MYVGDSTGPCVHTSGTNAHLPQAALPFKSKPKLDIKKKRKSLDAKRAVVAEVRVVCTRRIRLLRCSGALCTPPALLIPPIRTPRSQPQERKVQTFMGQLHTMHNERERKRKRKTAEKQAEHKAKKAREDAVNDAAIKVQRKKRYVKAGMEEKKYAKMNAKKGSVGDGDD